MSDHYQELLNAFAPVVTLSGNDQYRPTEVTDFIKKCSLMYEVTGPDDTFESTASPETINEHWYRSTFFDDVASSYHKTPENTDFYLALKNEADRCGTADFNKVPFYGAVFEGSTYCDLIYGFFYAYDNSNAGLVVGSSLVAHEGDWEHVIVRVGRDSARQFSASSDVLGAYFQAHGVSAQYSRWYYPPGSASQYQFQWWGTQQRRRVRVYASDGSHGSYVDSGWQEYDALGFDLLWPDDYTDSNGPQWGGTPNVQVMTGFEKWNDFNGHFGDDGGPRSPKVQGWLRLDSRSGGPNGATTIGVAVQEPSPESEPTSYSQSFKLDFPGAVRWTVAAALTHDHLENLVFGISNGETDIEGIKHAATSENADFGGAFKVRNLSYSDSTGTYHGADVFRHLGVDELTLTVADAARASV